MDAEQIKDVLVEVGQRRSDLKVINGWVSTKCVLAPWTHQKGRDGAPSAGVKIGDEPIWNCFTCGNPRPLHALVRQYAEYTGEDLDGLIEELEDNAFLGPVDVPSWDTLKNGNQIEVMMPLNEAMHMDLYDSAVGHPYLRKRGISDDTARKLELLFDPEDMVDAEFGRRVGRILFPVRGINGELYGFSGRDVTGNSLVKVRDYSGLKKANCVLGAHLVAQENPGYVLPVEGLFDYAAMWEQGEPGAAVMHSSLTAAQANIFRELALPAYMFYDDDEAGQKGVREFTKLLVEYIPLMRVRYPEIWIENRNEPGGGHYVKDPGELLKEDIEWMKNDSLIVAPPPKRKLRHY